MTDPKTLNQTLSEGQSAMYARQLEETIRIAKKEQGIARQGLADVGRVLCPDQVDFLTEKYPGSSATTLPLEEFLATMKGVAQTLRLIAANSTKSPGSKEEQLLARVMELEGLLRAEKRRADLFERSKARAEQALEAEQTRAVKAARVRGQQASRHRVEEIPPPPGYGSPTEQESSAAPSGLASSGILNEVEDWEAWKAHFELEESEDIKAHVKHILEWVGKTGKATLTEIANSTGLDPLTAKAMTKIAADRYNLLAEQETGYAAASAGPLEKLYFFSRKGEWYVNNLVGLSPVPSKENTRMRSDRTRRHTGLISMVGVRFKFLGWEVDYAPQRIEIADQIFSQSDLVIKKDGLTLYVEVETGERIRTESADQWEAFFTNAYRASQGVLCVVTETKSQMTTLLGKINFWLVQKKVVPICIYATTLPRLADAQPDESPWEKIEQKMGQA